MKASVVELHRSASEKLKLNDRLELRGEASHPNNLPNWGRQITREKQDIYTAPNGLRRTHYPADRETLFDPIYAAGMAAAHMLDDYDCTPNRMATRYARRQSSSPQESLRVILRK